MGRGTTRRESTREERAEVSSRNAGTNRNREGVEESATYVPPDLELRLGGRENKGEDNMGRKNK